MTSRRASSQQSQPVAEVLSGEGSRSIHAASDQEGSRAGEETIEKVVEMVGAASWCSSLTVANLLFRHAFSTFSEASGDTVW